jgi:uncharacterized protein YcbK (DUF882 family)
MPSGRARLNADLTRGYRLAGSFGLAALIVLFGCKSLQTAVANGDTRTLSMHHTHTNESITITFKRNGRYDEAALKKINWFLRDWRRQEETRIDPHLLDVVWEVVTELRAQKPIEIICGYRAPATNEMLRQRSSGVAKASLHTQGQALDFFMPDVPLEQLRHAGLRLQRGGVGYYPGSDSPFVHLDTGKIRHWPDISREELARVFPNGRTVHVPSDGRPLAGYALALNDLEKRGLGPSQPSLDAAQSAGIPEAARASARAQAASSDESDDNAAARAPKQATYRTAEASPPVPTPARLASVPLPRKRPVFASDVAQAGAPKAAGLVQIEKAMGSRMPAPAADVPTALAYAPAGAGAQAAIAQSIVSKNPAPTRVQPTYVAATPAPSPMAAAATVAAAKSQNTDDLWTRAVLMAPDLQYYMSTTLLGKPDFKQLRSLMQKPALALALSFGDDPTGGLSIDRFGGDSAVVFLATLPTTPTQSAMLQQ